MFRQDRNSEFKPNIDPKNKRDILEIKNKMLEIFVRRRSTKELDESVQKILMFEVFAEMANKIIDRILPETDEW